MFNKITEYLINYNTNINEISIKQYIDINNIDNIIEHINLETKKMFEDFVNL